MTSTYKPTCLKSTGQVQVNDEVLVNVQGVNGGEPIAAHVSRVGAYIKPDNRTFSVRVDFDQRTDLIPNLVTELLVNDLHRLCICRIACRHGPGEAAGDNYVWVLEETPTERHRVVRRIIQPAPYNDMTLIVSGLQAGEHIIDRGVRKVENGDLVKVITTKNLLRCARHPDFHGATKEPIQRSPAPQGVCLVELGGGQQDDGVGHHRHTVIAGLTAYSTLPKESFPEVIIPEIYVGVAYPGNSPEDMEKLITRPLEKEINTITGIDEIISTSTQGYATVDIKFDLTNFGGAAQGEGQGGPVKADPEWPDDLPPTPTSSSRFLRATGGPQHQPLGRLLAGGTRGLRRTAGRAHRRTAADFQGGPAHHGPRGEH